MTDFLKQKKRENEPSSFSAWMRKNGTQLQNTLTPDKAASEKARSTATHGTAAEGLFDKGLSQSGYARFLADEAARSFQGAKQKYEQDTASMLEKNLSGYARYLTSHEQTQASLRKQMIDRIGNADSFNSETAYQIALTAGLTEENARVAASLGITAAKEKAASLLLERIVTERLAEWRAMQHALNMGFSQEEAQKFGEYAKTINATKNPTNLLEDLFK